MNIAGLLARSARQRPETTALVHGDVTFTYRALQSRVARFASSLSAAGVQPGARVAILQHNGPALLETLFACFHGGFVAVPVNARSTAHEVRTLAEDAQPQAWVFDEVFAEHAEAASDPAAVRVGVRPGYAPSDLESMVEGAPGEVPPAAVAPDGPAWLFYTSGTTGRMKGATLTHRNLRSMVLAYLCDIRDGGAGTYVLHAAPLTHGSGLYALPPIARGVTQAITTSSSYDPEEVLDCIARDGVTDVAFLVPTMVKRLVEAQTDRPRRVSTLESIVYGGSPMYVDDLRHALEAFGPVLTQIYGQAEAPVTISRLTRREHVAALEEGTDRLSSAGTPFLGVDVAVDAGDGPSPSGTGEILVRGDVVMRGYWNNAEATQQALADGWLHTGDIARVDSAGYLHLLDRSKDVIISGGANIYPREVEEVILEHPLVREAAVVGAPDDEWGERVVAVIALLDDGAAARAEVESAVVQMCRERLAGYKRPRQFDWVGELPKNPYGKILKRDVRAQYWGGHDRQI